MPAEVARVGGPMTDRERLYVAQALYKTIADEVSTKGHGVRARCDAEAMDDYRATGHRSSDALLNGVKVGTYVVKLSKPRPATPPVAGDGLREADPGALLAWARENGFTYEVVDYEAVERHFRETGEVPPGCEYWREEREGDPGDPGGEPVGTALTIDPKKVAEALGPGLPHVVAGLLTGGEGDG